MKDSVKFICLDGSEKETFCSGFDNLTVVAPPTAHKKSYSHRVFKGIRYSDISPSCVLDAYVPESESFDTVVHFHGGGLDSGRRDDEAHVRIAETVAGCGTAFLSADYGMYPEHAAPDFFYHCAAAVAYAFKNYRKRGRVFVSGQSAGAYIALMLCLEPEYLMKFDLRPREISGWLIESGQPTTHFNVLAKSGRDSREIRLDEFAPLACVGKDTEFSRMRLMCYTRDIPCRLEQNMLLLSAIRSFNPSADVELCVYAGNHCVLSTTPRDGRYVYADILLDFIGGTSTLSS